jgi:uncharacterized protein (DUF1330 family)
MPAFIIATTVITDPPRFMEYVKAISGLAERFGGETYVRGPVTEVLEGVVPEGERVIVTRYPDAAAAKAYLYSDEYQAAKLLRKDAGDVVVRMIVVD